MTKDDRETQKPVNTSDNPNTREFGEGNYKAARDYKRDIDAFQKDHSPGEIEKAARDAADALEGEEGKALNEAERKGRNPARH